MQSVNFTLSNFDNIEKSKDTFDEKMVEPLLTLFRDKFKVDACFIALVVEDTYELVIGKNSVTKDAEQFVRIYHLGKEGYEKLFKNYDEDLICDHANSILDGESILHYGVFRDDGTLDGIVGFADFHNKNRVWTKEEKTSLAKLGKTLRLAVLYEKIRIQSKEQISRLRNEFKDQINIITSATSDYSSIFLIDYDTLVQTLYYSNGRYKAILDIATRELYYPKSANLAIYASVYKDDRKRVLEAMDINNVKARLAADGYYTVNYRRYFDDELDYAAFKFSLIELNNKKYIVLAVKEVTESSNQDGNFTNYDELTGLFTKDEFMKRCEEKMSLTKDYSNLYMIAFDVDNITSYNAYFGVMNGNILLKHIASILKTLSEKFDAIYCRLGADRFAIFVEEDFKKIDELIINIKSNIRLFNPKFYVNLSFGVAHVENNIPTSAVLERAIAASRTIKYKYEPMYSVYTKTINKKREIDHFIIENMDVDLKNHKILPYYQPVIDLDKNMISSLETLVRWETKDKLLEAKEFLEVFKITRYIYKLDYQIWEDAIKLIKDNMQNKKDVYPISLNICDDYIIYDNLPDTLNKLIKRYNIAPELVNLELREKNLLKNIDKALPIIKTLKANGFNIVLDNFTSAISLLNEEIFDYIKIDMSSYDLNKNNSKIILKNIFNLANSLNIKIIAAKVEDESTLNFLKENNIKYAQGYYFSNAKPKEEIFK